MSTLKQPTPEKIAEQKLYREMGLSDSEYERVVGILGRQPNYVETGLYSAMWSEHCSYKNSKPVLKRFPTKGERVLQGPGEGAGIVDIGDGQAVVFKIESHNHPSAVEPFHGASTGVGGIIRDVFSMGARPIAALNSLRFGSLYNSRVQYLLKNVVAGIADYGNTINVPTVGGEVVFEDSYEGNPLVNAMVVGLINHDQIQKGLAKGVGNPVIYAGASTGRDGIHGANFASEELSDTTEHTRPTVPMGNPQLEKVLMEACLEIVEQRLVEGIQDMGAAGLTSSSTEMASKAGNGLILNLDKVPQREPNMTAYEMMLSETQERMLLVAKHENVEKIGAIFDKWGVQWAIVGEVTDDKRYRLQHQGEWVTDVPVDSFVEDAPVYYRESMVPQYYTDFANAAEVPECADVQDAFVQLLKSPSIASKEWVYRQYDYNAGNATAVAPGSDAGVVRVPNSRKALAMTTDGNGRYVYLDPEVGGAITVAEAARNVVCSGAVPLAVTDNLNFGNPEKPEIFWQFEKAADGISKACLALNAPVIGGNVSFYNESNGAAIYPTPVIGMVGLIEDVDHITTQSFKAEGDVIVLLGDTYAELHGTEYQKVFHKEISGRPPQIDLDKEQRVQRLTLQAIRKGLVQSAHDLADGGLAVALAESAIAGGLGAEIVWEDSLRMDQALFSESQSRILLSVKRDALNELIQLAVAQGVTATELGKVGGNRFRITYNNKQAIEMALADITSVWKGELACVMNGSSTN